MLQKQGKEIPESLLQPIKLVRVCIYQVVFSVFVVGILIECICAIGCYEYSNMPTNQIHCFAFHGKVF